MERRKSWFLLALAAVSFSLAHAQAPPIDKVAYRAALGEKALLVDATLSVTRPARTEASVRLFSTRYPIVGELPKGEAARVIVRDGAYWLLIEPVGGWLFARPKPAEVTLSFRVPITQDGDFRSCELPVLSSMKVLVDLPAELHELSVTPPAPVEAAAGRLRLYAPAHPSLVLSWRAAPAAAPATPVFRVDADTNVSVTTASLTAETALRIEVLQGEVRALTLALPEGSQLRAISGQAIARWELAGGKVQAELRAPLRTKAELSVTTESLPEKGGGFVWWPLSVAGAHAGAPDAGAAEPAGPARAPQHEGGRAYFRAASGLLLRATDRKGFERVSDGYAPDEAAGRQTLVLVYPRLPASLRLAVEPLQARLTADVAMLAQLERGIVTQRAEVNYTIFEVGVRQFQLRIGQGAEVLEVACPGLLDYQVDKGLLTVRVRDAVKEKAQLKLVVQRPMERVDGVVVPRLEVVGVERQTSLVGVAAGANVELRHSKAVEAEQVDVRLLPEWVRKLGPKLAYRYYDRPNSQVAVETAPLMAEFDAVAQESCILNDEGWTRQLAWRCEVQRGEVFAWRVRLPEGVAPLEVTGTSVKDWELDEAARVLKVALARGLKEKAELSARFSQRVAQPPSAVPGQRGAAVPHSLRAIVLEGARRQTGELHVQAAIPVSLRPTRLPGLEAGRVSAQKGGSTEGQLAFGQQAADWELDLAAAPIDPVVEVTSVTVLGTRPGQVAVEVSLLYSIQKAPVNSLTLRLPEGAVNSVVLGEGIKSSQLEGRLWTVYLVDKLLGPYRLRVTYDHVIPAEGGTCAAATLEVPGAARHEGFLLVAKDSDRIEVALAKPDGLAESDPAEVPSGRVSLARPIIAAYRFTNRGGLEARIGVLGRAEVLQARALGAIVETVLREDGQLLTQLTYDIRNANRQFLGVELPKDAVLLAAYVDGTPVSAAASPGGVTLVPLLGKKGTDRAVEVAVLYAQRRDPLVGGRNVKLTSPPVDVRTEALSWAVYLPRGYRAQGTRGNMNLLFRPPQDTALGLLAGMFEDEGRALEALARVCWAVLAVAWESLREWGRILLPLAGVLLLVLAAFLGLRRSRRSARARGGPAVRVRRIRVVEAVVVLLVVALLAGMLLPALSRSREEARRIRARNNLNQIAKALATYLNEHGDNRFYPATIDQIKLVCPDEGVFIDPTSGRRFVYLWEGRYMRDDMPPNQPVGYMEGAGGVSVVFCDSHTEFRTYDDPQLAQLFPGRHLRPPTEREIADNWRAFTPRASMERAPGTSTAGEEESAGGAAREQAKQIADLEEKFDRKDLDYGQRKLLGRIKGRSQASRESTVPAQGLDMDMPVVGGKVGDMTATPPAKEPGRPHAKPSTPAPRPEGKPEGPKAPGEPGPPTAKPKPPPGAVAGVEFHKPLPYQSSAYLYAPVRGGRQKGALPVLFELPTEASVPYIFHRPVTGAALGEIELDCRRRGASRPAEGALVLGIAAFVLLVGAAVAKTVRRRA